MHITNTHDAKYHDLKPFVDNFHTKASLSDLFLNTNGGLVILGCLTLVIIGIITILLLFAFKEDLIILQGVIAFITLLILFSPVTIGSQIEKDFDNKEIELALKQNDPHFETVHVKGEIDDISNGSDRDNQEVRFNDGKHIYYVTIPSDTIVRSGDSINVTINNRLVDKNTKQRVLSDTINKPKNKVTIKHQNQTNHSHIIFNHEKEDI
ncbi:MAG: hypothetical protein E6618_12420 [Staphylococcus warneri]|nr:hypothetical protein [Staphylococcus warneri]